MTRQRAISHLKDISMWGIVKADEYNALKMAIKALEQEPCNDEYIKVPKKALKYRTAGMVAYNAEWLKKNWQMEMDIVCGVKPCDDAISRQAVIDALYDWSNHSMTDAETWHIRQVIGDIKSNDFKAKEPKTEWIPISEGLPEDYQRVLVTVQTAYRKIVRSGTFMQEDTFWIDNGDFWKTTDIEIIAWMPLPPSYQGK